MARTVLVLCDDLMWLSRFSAVGQPLGIGVRGARTLEHARQLLTQQPPSCMILDLALGRASDMLQELKPLLTPGIRLLAFGAHVDTASLADARAAGCDPVLPRSVMAERLAEELPRWAA
jgi:CheY-like chemotaxis protein